MKILNKGTSNSKNGSSKNIFFDREREYFRQKQPKKYLKVVYLEENDSEPEVVDSQYVPKETEEEEIEKPETEKKTSDTKKKKLCI